MRREIRKALPFLVGFFLLTVLAWAADYTENWGCADSASINCDQSWDENPYSIGDKFKIATNRVSNSGNFRGAARMSTQLSTTDMDVQQTINVATPTTGTNNGKVLSHMNGSTSETYCGCELFLETDGDKWFRAFYYSGGTFTQIQITAATYTPASDIVIKNSIVGTSLTCTFDPGGANEASVSGTCSVAQTKYAGIGINAGNGEADGVVKIDSWSATATGTTDVPSRRFTIFH
jgi:hypothetical protein